MVGFAVKIATIITLNIIRVLRFWTFTNDLIAIRTTFTGLIDIIIANEGIYMSTVLTVLLHFDWFK